MKRPSSSRYVLFLLLAVNLLNYIDRQVIYAVFPLIKADLAITDTQLGTLGSAFMLSYMITAPLFGWIGDSWSRTRLAAAGLFFWSIATASAGLTRTYHTLLLARTAVGVGEASFGTVSPGLLSDFFPKEKRGRVLSYFYLAIPVGSAIGYLAGGVLGHHFGWQAAFLMVGLPGLILILPVLLIREPEKPANADVGTRGAGSGRGSYRELFVNRSFVLNTLAMAAMTFALGGLAQWLPSFLNRFHHLDVAAASTRFGGITVVAGIIGTLAGGWLGDFLQKKTAKGYLILSGWGLLIGAPISYFAIAAADLTTCLALIFFAEFFLFLNTGPLNTVIVNVTRAEIRAMAFAVNIFFIHVLGEGPLKEEIGKICGETVYGRGADDTVRKEIHRLRMRMEVELARESEGSYNIKTGRGGMVDVEFVVQFLQLKHGGEQEEIRSVNTLKALKAIGAGGIMHQDDCATLIAGYKFLRRLENRLRIIHDYSMNDLGGSITYLNKLARRLGYDPRLKNPGEALLAEYEQVTESVRKVYDRVFGS